MAENYFSIAQLNTYIKNIFEAEVMLQNILVYGEVSSYTISNGIAYFNLKDESGMLSCVLFGANNFDKPKLGDLVLVRGSMNYYAKGGKLSFNAYDIRPYGRGLLYEKFLKLKQELEDRGYFDPNIKKPIPTKLKRIGVVTSPTGAVIRDIIDVTHRRNDTLDIVLYPVKVQGIGADMEIAQGIDFFSKYKKVDVIIVARGGGSIEDLEPFNSEVVANATFRCQKPVVSAVGHETDFTIIDFVADLRAPTPSAAAEIVAWDKALELEKINGILYSMQKDLLSKIDGVSASIDISIQKIDNITNLRIERFSNALDREVSNLSIIERKLDATNNTIDKLNILLDSCNPNKLASMGYSKVIQNGKVISKIKNIDRDKVLEISMIDGNIRAKAIE